MDFKISSTLKKAELTPDKLYDTLILGLGPAGLNAALYLRRKGLEVGIIGRQAGGQVADTSTVENYLGYTGLTGMELVEKFEEHVAELDTPIIRYYGVTEVKQNEDKTFSLTCEDGNIYRANSLIVATGAASRKIGVPGEEKLFGRGVTYCAICDGPLYKGLDVVVAGGGNSAVEAAIDLAKTSKSVTIVHRSQFRADRILLDQLAKFPNITWHLETQILSVNGEMGVESITVLDKKTGAESEIKTEGVFVEIGTIPNSAIVKDFLELNANGEILAGANGETNVPGVYAAGDVTQVRFKQIIIAAAQGAEAALALNDWYNTREV